MKKILIIIPFVFIISSMAMEIDTKNIIESYLKDSAKLSMQNLSQDEYLRESKIISDNYLPVFFMMANDKGQEIAIRKRFLHEILAIFPSSSEPLKSLPEIQKLLHVIATDLTDYDITLRKDFLDIAFSLMSSYDKSDMMKILGSDFNWTWKNITTLKNPIKEISFFQNYLNYLQFVEDKNKYDEVSVFAMKYVSDLLMNHTKEKNTGNLDMNAVYAYFFEKCILLNKDFPNEKKLELITEKMQDLSIPINARINVLNLSNSMRLLSSYQFFRVIEENRMEIASSSLNAYLIEKLFNFYMTRGNIQKAEQVMQELKMSKNISPQLMEKISNLMKGNRNEN